MQNQFDSAPLLRRGESRLFHPPDSNEYLDNSNHLIQPLRINTELVSEESVKSAGEKLGLAAGLFIAILGTIAQGMLSFLLFNFFIRKLNLDYNTQEWIIWPLGIAIGILTIIGKISVFSHYTFPSFQETGKNLLAFVQRPRRYLNHRSEEDIISQLKTICDLPWTIIAAAVHGIGVTHIAFKGVESLLVDNYSHSALLTLAHIIGNPFFMAPFMAAGCYSFYLVFPWVHANGANRVRDALNHFLENPKYRQLKLEQIRALEVIAREWKKIITSQNSENILNFLTAFTSYEQDSLNNPIDTENLDNIILKIESILTYAKSNINSVPPETWKEFMVCNGAGLLATAYAIGGLYVINQVGVNTAQLLHIPTVYLQQRMGTSVYTSMSLMAIDSIYVPVKKLFANSLFERNYHTQALSRGFILVLSALLLIGACLMGLSNGYLKYSIDGFTLGIFNAILSYALLDIFTLYSKAHEKLESVVIKKDPFTQLGKVIDDKIKSEINNVYFLNETTLKQRATFFAKAPAAHLDMDEISPEIQAISPDRKSWKFAKKVAGKLGNAGIKTAAHLFSCCGIFSPPACLEAISFTVEDAADFTLDTLATGAASSPASGLTSAAQLSSANAVQPIAIIPAFCPIM